MSRYVRMCKHKRRYCTRSFALEIAKCILQKQPKRELRPYRCPYCKGFHLYKNDSCNIST